MPRSSDGVSPRCGGLLVELTASRGRAPASLRCRYRHHAGTATSTPLCACLGFHLLGASIATALDALLRRGALRILFDLSGEIEPVLKLMRKSVDVPINLADRCLLRMPETFPDPVRLTTDADFCIHRPYRRQIIPCMSPITAD